MKLILIDEKDLGVGELHYLNGISKTRHNWAQRDDFLGEELSLPPEGKKPSVLTFGSKNRNGKIVHPTRFEK